MSWLPLPYIQLESARTNGTDYFDTQWNAGYGFGVQFAGCAFTDGAYLFGAMTSEESADKFALQFQDGKYIYHFGDKTAESPATYELGEPHFFSFNSGGWNIDGVSMPSVSFSLSPSNEMKLPVYVGAVNVGGEAQHLSDVQIGFINFNGSSGQKEWHQCKTQDGQFGLCLYSSGSVAEFVEKPDFTYGEVMAAQSSASLIVIGAPTKKDYKLGEPFDPTGMTVYLPLDDGTRRNITSEAEAKYPDGSTEFRNDAIIQHGIINYIYYRYKPFGVDYTFYGISPKNYYASIENFPYTVSSDSPVESIEVTKLPDKTEYLIKEYFSTTGMIVTGHLENGDTAEIGDSTSYSGISYSLSTAGTFDVTVNWYDGSKYLYAEPFQITVKNAVDKLNITLPTKSEYSIGEEFNPTGITVTALYLDGTETPVLDFSVDSSAFDSAKEGAYPITVTATVDEKEYTETITVYVFGEPKRLEDLLGTTEGMTVIRNNVKNDDNKDTVPGADWFVFDGNTASNIYVSGNNFVSFNNTTEHIKICRRDGATYYVYSQVGKLDNGHKFLKIRVEGYTNYGSTASEYALKYELFLFDDNSMFLNIVQVPTNTSYLGTSELLYGTTHTTFTVEAGKSQVFSFYTTDVEQGKPWTAENKAHKFIADLAQRIEAVPTKREYSIGDSFDATAFTVEAVKYDGTTSPITEFTAVCDSFDGQSEGRYPVTVTAQINGLEYTAQTLVAVYGEAHDILDLLNTKDGMNAANWPSSLASELGDVSWFIYDGKPVEEIGASNRHLVYFNKEEILSICTTPFGTGNNAYIQEGNLENGHKFLKLRCEWTGSDADFPTFELFLFDDNSMYLYIIRPASADGTTTSTQLTWSEGQIEVPVTTDDLQKFSFYTDTPSEGRPWTMELDYHIFIKEKMRTLTVDGGSGSGKYLPGELVTVKAVEREGYRLIKWVSNGELFSPKPKIINTYSGDSPFGFKDGNLLVFAYWDYKSEESSSTISGWAYDGTLTESGDKDAGSTENVAYVHIYHKINDGNLATGQSGYFFEVENAKSLELQESTRQENLLLTSANSFLCKKETDDLYLWFLYAMYWSTSRRWVTQPDVVSYFPDVDSSASKAFSVLFDENVPPVSFRASVSSAMATRYGSAIGARIIPSCTGYEYKMTFTMPDEDLTIEAEFEPRIKELDITSMPLKTDYQPGESFEKSGLKVDAVYYGGTRKPITDYVLAGFDSNTSGQKTITITYTEKDDIVTASFTVSVGASGIVIESYPKKKSYALGEQLDTEGLSVAMAYADNSSSPIEDLEITGFDSDEVGAKTVNVTYKQDGNTYNSSYTVYVTEDGQNPFSGYNPTRTLRIHSLDGNFKDITGDEIESESMSLTESIGNDSNLRFGGCVSTQFSVNIFSEQFLSPNSYPDGDIEVFIEADNQQMKIFTGTIESAERTGGINKRKLVAYDYLKRKSGIKLKNWYKSLKFPMVQRDFRRQLLEYVGIKEGPATLKYDDARVPDNMNVESLTFLSLIKDICLNNMCFGHITAGGVFEYIFLNPNGYMPDGNIGYRSAQHSIDDGDVINCTFKEGRVWYPQTFWINPNPNDPEQGQKEPSDLQAYNGNIYFVRNSYMIGDVDWILKSYRHETVNADGNVFYEVYEQKYPIVKGPSVYVDNQAQLYLAREYSLTTPGDFMRKLGDGIQFNSIKYREDGTQVVWTINSFIMSRTISGVVGLREVDSAKNSAYNEEVYGAAKEIRDNSDTMVAVERILPKSTSLDEEGDNFDEPFKGVDTTSEQTWDEIQEELVTNPEAVAAREVPNKFYAYKNPDGTAGLRYNGYTMAGGGGLRAISVEALPENPDPNTIYLIQGEVVVE